MGLLSIFRAPAVQRAAEPRTEPRLVAASPSVESESQWKGMAVSAPSRAGVRVDESTALTLPAMLQAVRVLCGVFAMTPLHYYQRVKDGRDRADEAGVGALLLTRPNSHQSAFAFFELLMGDLLLAGDFYAYVSRNFRGEPVALTRLKPSSVVVAEYFDRAEGRILFYDASLPDGTHERFAARDIWHIAGMSRDGIKGLNPIGLMRDALGGAIATSNHTSSFWSKGGRPKTVLESEAKIGPGVKEAIRGDWARLYGGLDGEAVAVTDQGLKAKFLTHDLKSDQFLETRQFQVVDLARIIGVPPHLIFDLSRSTNNNIEHQSLEFLIYHLGPHFARVSSAANRQFAGPGYYFEHLTDSLVQADMKSRMEAYWLQRQMGMVSADELRARDNLSQIGGDAGGERWRPSNMAIAGQPVAAPVPPNPKEGNTP